VTPRACANSNAGEALKNGSNFCTGRALLSKIVHPLPIQRCDTGAPSTSPGSVSVFDCTIFPRPSE
jgi:hypothetical protein